MMPGLRDAGAAGLRAAGKRGMPGLRDAGAAGCRGCGMPGLRDSGLRVSGAAGKRAPSWAEERITDARLILDNDPRENFKSPET